MEHPELEELLTDIGIEEYSDQRDSIVQVYEDMLNYMDEDDALAVVEQIVLAARENYS